MELFWQFLGSWFVGGLIVWLGWLLFERLVFILKIEHKGQSGWEENYPVQSGKEDGHV